MEDTMDLMREFLQGMREFLQALLELDFRTLLGLFFMLLLYGWLRSLFRRVRRRWRGVGAEPPLKP
jgi:hypothetical protein